MFSPLRRMIVVLTATAALLIPGTIGGALVRGGEPATFTGAFEFEGLAAVSAGKGCRGEGAFGVMKRKARVLLSERVASGDFETLGRGRIRKGRTVETADGEEACRMRFKVKADAIAAADSRIYLEVKGVTFDISWPADDVTDGDLGTWRCEYSDNTCAKVVGQST